MVKCLKIDRNASTATIRFNLDELKVIVDSISYMTDKHEANLLGLSPDKKEREKIAEYVKIMKNLGEISRALM